MELNTAYDVVRANNRRERETQATALQENIVYIVNERSPTQTDEDNEYSTIENIGRERYTTNSNIAHTDGYKCTTSDSVLGITQRIRQEVVKNESGKKRFAILAVIAFVLSLLVAVAALVYTNIELKNQMNRFN